MNETFTFATIRLTMMDDSAYTHRKLIRNSNETRIKIKIWMPVRENKGMSITKIEVSHQGRSGNPASGCLLQVERR